jgi:hypothetical protein
VAGAGADDAAGAAGGFRRRGVASVDLRATADGEPLYRALGFVASTAPTMRLTLVSP